MGQLSFSLQKLLARVSPRRKLLVAISIATPLCLHGALSHGLVALVVLVCILQVQRVQRQQVTEPIYYRCDTTYRTIPSLRDCYPAFPNRVRHQSLVHCKTETHLCHDTQFCSIVGDTCAIPHTKKHESCDTKGSRKAIGPPHRHSLLAIVNLVSLCVCGCLCPRVSVSPCLRVSLPLSVSLCAYVCLCGSSHVARAKSPWMSPTLPLFLEDAVQLGQPVIY